MSESTMTPADISAMMGNGNNNSAMWNNPWIYMVWMMMLRNGFGMNGDAAGTANIDMNAKLNQLSQQIQDNQSTNTLNTAISSNHDYLHDFNNAVTSGFAATNAAINNGTTTGIIGNKDLTSALQSCCCQNQTAILNQTNQLQSSIENTRQAVVNGFAQLGYAQAQQTNELNSNATANTQRILDQMCTNTTQALRDKVAEYSQAAQTADIVSQLKSSCGCNS